MLAAKYPVDQTPGGTVWIASKEASGGIYSLSPGFQNTATAVATRVGSVPRFLTDAALAPDHSKVLLRSGNNGTIMNGPAPGSSPQDLTFPTQNQGEAVGFDRDSKYVFIASEGAGDLIRIPVSLLPTGYLAGEVTGGSPASGVSSISAAP